MNPIIMIYNSIFVKAGNASNIPYAYIAKHIY